MYIVASTVPMNRNLVVGDINHFPYLWPTFEVLFIGLFPIHRKNKREWNKCFNPAAFLNIKMVIQREFDQI